MGDFDDFTQYFYIFREFLGFYGIFEFLMPSDVRFSQIPIVFVFRESLERRSCPSPKRKHKPKPDPKPNFDFESKFQVLNCIFNIHNQKLNYIHQYLLFLIKI